MSGNKKKGSTATLSSIKRSSNLTKEEQQPAKKKINLSFGTNKSLKNESVDVKQKASGSLSIKLSTKPQKPSEEIKVVPKSKKAAAVFNESSDSEPEEMPMEARMRMKNIGRNTPTSAGPNSFNKGKLGFVDGQKSWEAQQQLLLKNLKTKNPSK